ncbi:uncharacterized protein LOC129569711 [Sitodiplosis mosellana]|uniref:uncharacterized protein LOC129569711 n=1 Tax=Sitodiplosis mosellana TaxID=263140 RepID=UPI00244463E3|nr:uncharacterized protein LOC129569711 [Sitodiplosis mosellana]
MNNATPTNDAEQPNSFSVNKTPLTFVQRNSGSEVRPRKLENMIREINDPEELVAETVKKWHLDDKFLFMGPDQEIPPHEKLLYTIVQDLMPNIKFLKNYGTQIQHLRIYCRSVNEIQPSIYAAISENCWWNLKEIEFYDLEGDEINSFTKEFPVIERVQFKSGRIGQNVAEAFKRNFSNVQTLEFSSTLTAINDPSIIKTNFQNLRELKVCFDKNGAIFNEPDIRQSLNMNQEHLQNITLWGESTSALLSFISDRFSHLKQLSLEGVSKPAMTGTFSYGRPYVFKQLQEFEITTVHDMRFPFDFGQLQKITMDLFILPDSWHQEFLMKNGQVRHLSLSVKPTMISDQIVPKIRKVLPQLRFLEIEFASNLKCSTIMDLINDIHLKEI